MKSHTKGFIAIFIAALLGFLTAWINSGVLNVNLIIYCLACIFGVYLLVSLYYRRR